MKFLISTLTWWTCVSAQGKLLLVNLLHLVVVQYVIYSPFFGRVKLCTMVGRVESICLGVYISISPKVFRYFK